jgi:two-component system response regulator YesN
VLLYTLSFINGNDTESTFKDNSENTVSSIVDYVNSHYRDTDISLKKIAYVFSYTEKYLSSLFKKQMNVGFNSYLNNLRVQYAQELIEKYEKSVSKIATLCGYSDAMYFSKVFKKYTGKTPTEYIKSKEKDRNNGIWQ